jgi:hypothetical protein
MRQPARPEVLLHCPRARGQDSQDEGGQESQSRSPGSEQGPGGRGRGRGQPPSAAQHPFRGLRQGVARSPGPAEGLHEGLHASSIEWALRTFGSKLVRRPTPTDVTDMLKLMREASSLTRRGRSIWASWTPVSTRRSVAPTRLATPSVSFSAREAESREVGAALLHERGATAPLRSLRASCVSSLRRLSRPGCARASSSP